MGHVEDGGAAGCISHQKGRTRGSSDAGRARRKHEDGFCGQDIHDYGVPPARLAAERCREEGAGGQRKGGRMHYLSPGQGQAAPAIQGR